MNITRHNYEEYFILFMDNELGIDQRRQVATFVQKNPALKEELDILLQYKLVPDIDIVYADKEELMVPVATGIADGSLVNPANYGEWLVLYTDNELTSEQRIAVEQFLAGHPPAKEALVMLQRTRLQPESTIFAYKESLYRNEEDPDSYRRRPFAFRWWRVAAAAIFILTVGVTVIMMLNKRTSGVTPGLAKIPANDQIINATGPIVNSNTKNSPVTIPVISASRNPVLIVPAKQAGNQIAVKNITVNEKPANMMQVLPNKEEPVVINNNDNKPTNNLPKPVTNSNLNNIVFKNDVANFNPSKEINSPSNALTNNDVTTHPVAPSYVKSTTSDDVVDLNHSEKKGRLRGFFRKVTRTFEKRTNIDPTDDDKLLVGGLAFKLK